MRNVGICSFITELLWTQQLTTSTKTAWKSVLQIFPNKKLRRCTNQKIQAHPSKITKKKSVWKLESLPKMIPIWVAFNDPWHEVWFFDPCLEFDPQKLKLLPLLNNPFVRQSTKFGAPLALQRIVRWPHFGPATMTSRSRNLDESRRTNTWRLRF